jgi:hypothetical protein
VRGWHRGLAWLLASTFGLATSGCGTIIHGTHMDLRNQTNPPGATLEVYRWKGERLAGPSASPGDVEVHRPLWHEPYLVRVSKPGRCPQYWLTTSPITGGSWLYLWMLFVPALGPILVAGTLGAIDGATGGCCGIEPHEYRVTLAEDYACPE